MRLEGWQHQDWSAPFETPHFVRLLRVRLIYSFPPVSEARWLISM